MRETITLKVTKGRLRGTEFVFDRNLCVFAGRRNDCAVMLPDSRVSRRHCALDISPPYVLVRDLSSLNGTWLNGTLIGGRNKEPNAGIHVMSDAEYGFVPLKDGDRLGVGPECELTFFSSVRDIMEDRVIDGYRGIELLGRSGMGEVWRARNEQTGEEFAFKFMSMRGIPAETSKLYFLAEAILSGELKHPHIVRRVAFGEWETWYYVAQELCAGGNVNDLMRRSGGRLSEETATHIILQTLDALDFAHHAEFVSANGTIETGFIHRNIQPENILLTDASDMPEVKISDFGLSKLYELTDKIKTENLIDPTGTGEFAGTAAFTPRVQIKYYKHAGPEADVWAAAATYYYMLTGLPPKDLSYADKWRLALIEDAIPIRKRNPDLPQKLAKVIDAALVEDPKIGCQSAREFKERIEGAL
ncbi:MAG: protein kinase [Clostridiales Family XIII bacterium]|jgi:serine/threonine protein kinase|nr:protein kinase [Clostridiales Family XIII bacterium]